MGAAALGLDAHVEVTAVEIPVELGPNLGDVGVVAGGFIHASRLLVDQPGPGCLTRQKAALRSQGFAADQLLQQGLPFSHRHHGALGQLAAQLLIKHTHRAPSQHSGGLGLEAAGPTQAAAHQPQIAP